MGKKEEYRKKLAFNMICDKCNVHSTHRFLEHDILELRLKCLNCGNIGYFVKESDFDEIYANDSKAITELDFQKIRDYDDKNVCSVTTCHNNWEYKLVKKPRNEHEVKIIYYYCKDCLMGYLGGNNISFNTNYTLFRRIKLGKDTE